MGVQDRKGRGRVGVLLHVDVWAWRIREPLDVSMLAGWQGIEGRFDGHSGSRSGDCSREGRAEGGDLSLPPLPRKPLRNRQARAHMIVVPAEAGFLPQEPSPTQRGEGQGLLLGASAVRNVSRGLTLTHPVGAGLKPALPAPARPNLNTSQALSPLPVRPTPHIIETGPMAPPQAEFNSISSITPEALGEPGKRTFRLLVEDAAGSAMIWMEKEQLFQLAMAITRLQAILPASGDDDSAPSPSTGEGEGSGPHFEFTVGKIVLGHEGNSDRFVIDAYDAGVEEERGRRPHRQALGRARPAQDLRRRGPQGLRRRPPPMPPLLRAHGLHRPQVRQGKRPRRPTPHPGRPGPPGRLTTRLFLPPACPFPPRRPLRNRHARALIVVVPAEAGNQRGGGAGCPPARLRYAKVSRRGKTRARPEALLSLTKGLPKGWGLVALP